jgi:hypothetical protein
MPTPSRSGARRGRLNISTYFEAARLYLITFDDAASTRETDTKKDTVTSQRQDGSTSQ